MASNVPPVKYRRRVVGHDPEPAAALQERIDSEGCAFGQVTRERLAHVQDTLDELQKRMEGLEARANYIVVGVGLQLLGTLGGLLVYVATKR